MATTLNPYYEGNQSNSTIFDDRLIRRTYNKWYFCRDFTGNIMDKRNAESILNESAKLGPVSYILTNIKYIYVMQLFVVDSPNHRRWFN